MKLLAIVTATFSLAGTIFGLLLMGRAQPGLLPVGLRLEDMLPFLVLQLAFTAVGGLLVWRRPENRIGWMLCATALVSSALFVSAGMTAGAITGGDIATASNAAWFYSWGSVLLGAGLGPALATFPDGRVTSRGAAAALALLAITILLTIPTVALRPGPLAGVPSLDNPYAWRHHGGILDLLFVAALAAAIVAMLFGVSSQISRFRRSSGVERQQLKWFLTSAVLMSVLMVPSIAWSYGDPAAASSQRYAGRVIGALASAALPVAIGIAILRHRLYDIDLLIRRTLVYAGVSVLLAATYVAAVVLTGAALRPFTAGSDLAVAASTLVVVALFQPVRRRLGDFVDRRFYRSRYDAARTLDAFGARLRNEVDLDSVRADLLGVVATTVRPVHASVWLRGADR